MKKTVVTYVRTELVQNQIASQEVVSSHPYENLLKPIETILQL